MDVSTSSTRSCTRRGSPPGPPSWPRSWRPPTPRPRSPAPPASPGCVTPPSDGGSSASPSPTRGCGHTGRFRDEKYLFKNTENICSSSVQIPSWQQCLENTSSEEFMRLPQGSVDIIQEFLTLSSTSSIKQTRIYFNSIIYYSGIIKSVQNSPNLILFIPSEDCYDKGDAIFIATLKILTRRDISPDFARACHQLLYIQHCLASSEADEGNFCLDNRDIVNKNRTKTTFNSEKINETTSEYLKPSSTIISNILESATFESSETETTTILTSTYSINDSLILNQSLMVESTPEPAASNTVAYYKIENTTSTSLNLPEAFHPNKTTNIIRVVPKLNISSGETESLVMFLAAVSVVILLLCCCCLIFKKLCRLWCFW